MNKTVLFLLLGMFLLSVGVYAGANTITLSTPAASGTVTGATYNLSALLVNNGTIDNVTFYYSQDSGVTWTRIASATNESFNDTDFSVSYDSSVLNDGYQNYTFNATAYFGHTESVVQAGDESATVSVDNTIPTITLTLSESFIRSGEQLTSTCSADDKVESAAGSELTTTQVIQDPAGNNNSYTGNRFIIPIEYTIATNSEDGYSVHCSYTDTASLSEGSKQSFSVFSEQDKEEELLKKQLKRSSDMVYLIVGIIVVALVIIGGAFILKKKPKRKR